MGTAQLQGSLWGAQARDYADLIEGFFCPAYEEVFDSARVGTGTRLLDAGCGPGLAARLAAERGAYVSGLDASEASITIARERTPKGDFRVGDMEALPWHDGEFDVVTSFNGFQFAADVARAVREARRVTRAGGRVVMLVWGPDDTCDTPVLMAALRELLPPQSSSGPPSIPLSAPGRLRAILEDAGMTPSVSGNVECPFDFPDLDAAIRGLTSAGAAVAVIQRVGAEPVRRALAESLAPFRTADGGYFLRNTFQYAVATV